MEITTQLLDAAQEAFESREITLDELEDVGAELGLILSVADEDEQAAAEAHLDELNDKANDFIWPEY